MAVQEIDQFLEGRKSRLLIDVRSPKEFEQGHIKQAMNIPLFSNEERAIVGTAYKQQSKEIAIEIGLEIVGPKMAGFVRTVKQLLKERNLTELNVYCWRGGMRSNSFAWLMNMSGIPTHTLKAGYKRYRIKVLQSFKTNFDFIVLGGKTGSGKTEILNEIVLRSEQVVDLELLACHKGSSFGALGQEPQPSIEQFENLLFEELNTLNASKRIWLEDESRKIGTVVIPQDFWDQMRAANVVYVNVDKAERIKRLVKEYAGFEHEYLASAINRIQKRLGGQHEFSALEALKMNDYELVADITLNYYDKSYYFGLSKREPSKIFEIIIDKDDPFENAIKVLNKAKEIYADQRSEINTI